MPEPVDSEAEDSLAALLVLSVEPEDAALLVLPPPPQPLRMPVTSMAADRRTAKVFFSDIYLTGDRTVYAGWRAVTIPQTGDSGQMNLWSTALCASFAGCVALIVWKIRRREKKSL